MNSAKTCKRVISLMMTRITRSIQIQLRLRCIQVFEKQSCSLLSSLSFHKASSRALRASSALSWPPSSIWIIFPKHSVDRFLKALFSGGPRRCGNRTEVSTTVLWISFSARRSFSKLCPIMIVLGLKRVRRTAWTSGRVFVAVSSIFSVIPLNLVL